MGPLAASTGESSNAFMDLIDRVAGLAGVCMTGETSVGIVEVVSIPTDATALLSCSDTGGINLLETFFFHCPQMKGQPYLIQNESEIFSKALFLHEDVGF